VKPHNCIILAIDPAETSGWAIFEDGQLRLCGRCRSPSDQLNSIVLRAVEISQIAGRTLVVVGEKWAPYVTANLAPYWKPWDWALHDLKRDMKIRPAPKVVRVNVSTWRAKIYGGKVGRNVSKTMACECARQWYGLNISEEEHDMAEACMIGRWATLAPEVLEVIPKRFR